MKVDIGYGVVLSAVEASALGSGRPCGVYMFLGLPTQVFNLYDMTTSLTIIENFPAKHR